MNSLEKTLKNKVVCDEGKDTVSKETASYIFYTLAFLKCDHFGILTLQLK